MSSIAPSIHPLRELDILPFMKRWMRFSLRSMLVLLTVLSGLLAIQVNAVRRQSAAVRLILSRGGQVNYDFEYNSGGVSVSSHVSPWLLNQMGHDWFHEVWVAHVNWPECDSRFSPAEVEQLLCALPDLRRLRIGQATDDAMVHIGRMKSLEQLDMYCAGTVTDEGIAKLASLPNLKSLQLCNSAISDQGMASIAEIEALETLYLEGARQISMTGSQRCASTEH